MSKLFLTSAGLPKETRKSFLSLLSNPPSETMVAFIPTACHPEKDKSYVDRVKKEIEDIGMKMFEVDLVDENEQSLRDKLSKADVIFVNGGNTFYLLKWARTSGFVKVVKELINQGKIYVGVSAGSYIACPTIEVATWKHQDRNRVGMTDLTALNLVPFLITAHVKEEVMPIIESEAKKTDYPIAALTDKQAVLCVDGKYSIVGEGKKITFNNFQEF